MTRTAAKPRRKPTSGNAPLFHPAVDAWFAQALGVPTSVQNEAWPVIKTGRNTLIAAPTGSGKTLAAFLAALDDLFHQALVAPLPDETQVVYVSPLKALSNDIQKNLDAPLAGIRAELVARGLPDIEITTWVRTGDTPAKDRAKAAKRPPHIVVTTPESLYILLGSDSGRAMLRTTRSIIVDEIHALAPNKRGSHLALSLERLHDLCAKNGHTLQRIGLSATQKPIDTVAHFLAGTTAKKPVDCAIIDTGYSRERDLALEMPRSPLEAVMSGEQWKEVYDRIADLVTQHRTTLVFVNTRRLVERVARELSARIGETHIAAHHGSLSKEQRLTAEQRLKRGELKVLVATASLELGIDIGDVDLVCQLGSPKSIAAFLQRVGRSGHAVNAIPKGRLFPLSRDELVECAALLDAVRRGELDTLVIPKGPLDVLAQQIVAEVAGAEKEGEWSEDKLFALFRRAWPYRDLEREDFDALVNMLAEGFSTRRGRRGALIHHDAVNHVLRPRRGARLTAITSGGAIPDNADYRVMLEPENVFVGTVHEDFAVESLAGDVFQLGNQSYQILRVERGVVRVEDAHGQPPTIPFWLGEAPGRSDELSAAVARLRTEVATRLAPQNKTQADMAPAHDWLVHQAGVGEIAAGEVTAYLAAGYGALGCLPTQDTIVFERFFDESGGMQLVLHTPFGSRINRAWGLSLRKRFCRKFNFELQAAATEDNIVLSLTGSHSFDLAEVQRYLRAATVRDLLIQTVLDAPMFATRWRWVASTSLALPRYQGGKKRAPQLARMDAEDLIASVFPDQLACAENLEGPRDIPDHPLVRQTLHDCLHEAMDIDGLENILNRIESGSIRVVTRDLTEPSPLAMEVLSARPYAYLDDAPLEERRTQAVQGRRWIAPETASDLGRLDTDAIARVREEVWPDARNPEELHDALVWMGFFTPAEARENADWAPWLDALTKDKRAARIEGFGTEHALWIAAERLPQFAALLPGLKTLPTITAPASIQQVWTPEDALIEIIRGRLEGLGPVTEGDLAATLPVDTTAVTAALYALQTEGFALRGRYTGATSAEEWCDRRLLARIHRYTLKRLRAEIEPVAPRDFMRFLLSWQKLTFDDRMAGPDALPKILRQLEGTQAAAGAWESEILPARIADYRPMWLDDECRAGRVRWTSQRRRAGAGAGPVRATPITFLERRHAGAWALSSSPDELPELSSKAENVRVFLQSHGAAFFEEIVDGSALMRTQAEEALAELVAAGLVTADSFAGLRALLPAARAERAYPHTLAGRRGAQQMENAGRWALIHRTPPPSEPSQKTEAIEHIARVLLARYGVVFWRLLEREQANLPSWRDLLGVYRRMEARGDIRGGRFVSHFAGEQFATPDAIAALRDQRRKAGDGTLISVSGADPLNLLGILSPGAKLPALTGNRLLFRDGIPVATLIGKDVTFLDTFSGDEWEARNVLLRGTRRKATRGTDMPRAFHQKREDTRRAPS